MTPTAKTTIFAFKMRVLAKQSPAAILQKCFVWITNCFPWKTKLSLRGGEVNMIDTRQFAALIGAGAVKTIAVKGTAGGFTICADGKLIEARRGHPRVFRKLHTAAAFLKSNGIGSFTVDLAHWNPSQKAAL